MKASEPMLFADMKVNSVEPLTLEDEQNPRVRIWNHGGECLSNAELLSLIIGKGVGTLGNAATNVIFPLVILANAIAGLIGNGAAANLSLKLGEKKETEARASIGSSITLSFIISILFAILAYIFLPKLVYMFGCTENVYEYAISYGKIILVGAPFMIIYSVLSSIIRADGNPKYSMIMLVVGAIINIVLDPVFIFGFNMGVFGGGLATVIGKLYPLLLLYAIYLKLRVLN